MNQEEYIKYVKNCGHSQSMKRKFTKQEQKVVLKYWKNNPKETADQVASHFEEKFKMPVSCTGVSMCVVAESIGHLES